MRTLVSLALSLALIALVAAPTAAVVVDVSTDLELSDLDSTADLRARIEPMVSAIEAASDQIASGDRSHDPWESIRAAARDGIATTLGSAVRECSKDYWAMTYTSFGLYYLATTRMLDSDDPDRAYGELATAMEATNLSESAYERAVRDCGLALAFESQASRSSVPPSVASQPAPGRV